MLKVTIVSPLEKYTADGLEALYLETVDGERGILQNHIAIVAQLKTNSLVRLKTAAAETRLRVGAGAFFKFSNNEAVILAQNFAKEEY